MSSGQKRFVNPEVLPSFFKDVEIIGCADSEIPKYQKRFKSMGSTSLPQKGEVSVDKSPVLLTTQNVKNIYMSNDFNKIRELETKSQNDLKAVYDNISKNGAQAWTKVSCNNKEFYMSWSNSGCMWALAESNSSSDKTDQDSDMTYQSTIQIGTYSKTSGILGIQSFNLKMTVLLVESAIALVLAVAVSGVIAEGLGFAFTAFALLLAKAAATLGFEAFTFVISATALANVAVALVFCIVFIGLIYLWNWLNRKYTIRLQIFNWDDKNTWTIAGNYVSNAKIAGDESELNFTLPKMTTSGGIVVPPGFQPIEALDSVCYYGVIIWENDNTFMEGCSMALGIEKNDTEGFTWAFDCPRFSDNKHAASDGLIDPKTYRKTCSWNYNPLSFNIFSTSTKIPICFALDNLSGAKDNLYNINIHINKNSLEQVFKEGTRFRLKSYKNDYLHRPDSVIEPKITAWDFGEWTAELVEGSQNKIRLRSWKNDYLHRPDRQNEPKITAWNTGVGNEWYYSVIDENTNKIKLKSWKNDYLCRNDNNEHKISVANDGGGIEWIVEVI